jgi:hypothetical protein
MTWRPLHAWLGGAVLLVVAGCGGAAVGGRPSEEGAAATARAGPTVGPPPAPATLFRVQGARALALPRAVEGVVHLALFVDAGWRDATPPQLATVAARVAAARGAGVTARVEPDLTEWALTCPRAEIDACVARLAAVLALRDIREADTVRARRAVLDARRLALSDEARTADALAFAALWDTPEAGAFGTDEDDDAVDESALAQFAAAHYGPSRALVVAAGDTDATALESALERALAGAPQATATRREGTALRAADDNESVRVRVGETEAVSVVLQVADAGLARAIAARVESENADEGEDVSATPLREGGAVRLHWTERRNDLDALARRAADSVARLDAARHEVAHANAGTVPDALDALSRAHGRAFATGDHWPGTGVATVGTSTLDTATRIGIGVIVRGARRRSVRGRDPDEALAREAETRLRTALEGARRARVEADGVAGERAILANGARLAAQRLPGASTRALAVRFGVDHGAEQASRAGRAALAAETLAETCRERAAQRGASLHARTSAGSFGLLMTAPNDDALLALLRCALRATPDDRHLDAARRRRIDAVSPASSPAHHARALAARALAPDAPALIAPEASADDAAAVPSAEVYALLDEARRGARTGVVWVGDGQPPMPAIARRLALLEPGTPHTSTAPGAAHRDDVLAAPWRGPGLRAVVALRATPPGGDATRADAARTARAFAETLATRLGEAPGLHPVASDGAALGADDVAAWVALDLDEAALEALPATLRGALAALATSTPGRDAVAAAFARLAAVHALARAVPSAAADRCAEALIAGSDAAPGHAPEPPLARVVDALAAAPWRVVVARPSRPVR